MRRLPLERFPAWAGSQGIFALEIDERDLPSTEAAYLARVHRACAHAGVRVAALTVANDFTMPDAEAHFRQVERVRQWLYTVAGPLEAPLVCVEVGMADASPAGEERALEAFRGLLPDLERTGVRMALENHARQQMPPERLAALITGVRGPLFGACVDFGSLPADGRLQAWGQLAPLAQFVHARSAVFDLDGEEVQIDYKAALAELRQYGYDGVISIVYEGLADPSRGVRDTQALLRWHWEHPEAGRRVRRRAA